jgi:hypothetical protein
MVDALLRQALISASVLCALFSGAWGDDPTPEISAADADFFERHVRPVLAERCFACHSAKAQEQNKWRGGLMLDSRVGLAGGGDNGPVVMPGDLDASRMIEAIRYGNTDLQMPPEGKLPAKEIAALEAWVKRGAPYPGETAAGQKKRSIDIAAGKQFWSFQPLRDSPLPPVRDTGWPQTRIDYFLLSRLESARLAASPPADRRTLIRRATFDLIGLPPRPEEVEEFLADHSQDAYARLVERLLASPHYGERWGRFWLDLVRYADSTPEWLTSAENAHRYRDWVVSAFNADLPYDRFIRLQLAADLMPETAPADIAALGFLGLSPTYWKELKLDKEVIKGIVADEWEERINTLGGALLGLTVACARCHDHKFDPITMEDYYALAGVFASSRITDRPLLPLAEAKRVCQAREQVEALERDVKALREKKPASANDQERAAALTAQIQQIKQATPHYDAPLAHGVDDAALYVEADGPDQTKLTYKPGEARDLPLFIRGNPSNPGRVVPRRFLAVLSPGAPRPFQHGSGRLELAEAIVGDAASLAARVIVNRVWRHHFGRGLVETPSNFGVQGARPTHPELLDDLAGRFVRQGWSLKALHREIMLSAAYQQSSAFHADGHSADPDNRLLGRMNRRRLEVEAWRDAMLAASGQLDRRLGGPAQELDKPEHRRRTLYGRVNRRDLHDMLRLYDFPDPEAHAPARELTTTPLQQLFVLNSAFVARQSAALAQQLQPMRGHDERIRSAYERLFARLPSTAEVRLGVRFVSSTSSGATPTEWQQYIQALLGSNEFMFVD